MKDWVDVLQFASPGPEPIDITDALRRAFASNAATVYLPFGRYTIHSAIELPATLRRFVGMNASITVRPEREPEFDRAFGMFRIRQAGPPLAIERLAFDMTDLGDQLAVEVSAARDVVLRDIVTAGTSLLDRKPSGGRVFIEDTCCGAMHIAGPQPVIARQLDTEGGDTRITNDGGNLAVLGLKTEGDCTVLDDRNGAHATILGGLLYIVGDADPKVPAFRDQAGGLNASFVEVVAAGQQIQHLSAGFRAGHPRYRVSAARGRPHRAVATLWRRCQPLAGECDDTDRAPDFHRAPERQRTPHSGAVLQRCSYRHQDTGRLIRCPRSACKNAQCPEQSAILRC